MSGPRSRDGFTVALHSSKGVITVPGGKTILDALLDASVHAPQFLHESV